MERDERPIVWIGSSLDDLRGFPDAARTRAGYELYRVQRGLDPSDWRSMTTVGRGTREVRIHTDAGGGRVEHRILYVATFEDAAYVLHAFRKTTRKTSRRDLATARARYRAMLRSRANR